MPQENLQKTSPNSPDFFIAGPDGQVFYNSQKLPLETLFTMEKFKEHKTLLRFAFDSRNDTLYIEDGRLWHHLIGDGDEKAWKILNVALRFLREHFHSQPRIRYGEPPGDAQVRSLSQYGLAWERLGYYLRKEFHTKPVDVTVVEYVPDGPTDEKVTFNPVGGVIGGKTMEGPTFFVNKNMGNFGQPDYEKVNTLLFDQYLSGFEDIHPAEWKDHSESEDELYFAIWRNGKTQIFRAKPDQRHRIIDEDALRAEPSLKGYKGPVILFSYTPDGNEIALHNEHRKDLDGSEVTRQMLRDIRSRMAKTKAITSLYLAHNDMQAKPFATKLSKETLIWDVISDILAPKAGIEPQDIAVIESPLTKDGSIKSMLIQDHLDEMKIPLVLALRAKHGTRASFPYIAIESRLRNKGMKYHELLKQYAAFNHALQSIPLIQYNFTDQKDLPFRDYAHQSEEFNAEIMLYMLQLGLDSKSILDFFCSREDLLRRSFFYQVLDKAKKLYDEEKQESRVAIMTGRLKTASVDVGINDWAFYTLQEDYNRTQHQNNKQDPNPGRPFNLREKKKAPQFSTSPKTTEGLLNNQHDPELGYMKSTEQLLRESQI